MAGANVETFLSNNKNFQQSFKDGDKKSPPARKVAIVTCMDARFHVEPALGLAIGDAHIIRNAGGRVSDDALRSLAISERLLGTNEIFVIHHSDCGMMKADNNVICEALAKDLGEKASQAGQKIDWLTFKSLEGSVRDDIQILRSSPLIPDNITIYGFIYDVHNGGLNEVK